MIGLFGVSEVFRNILTFDSAVTTPGSQATAALAASLLEPAAGRVRAFRFRRQSAPVVDSQMARDPLGNDWIADRDAAGRGGRHRCLGVVGGVEAVSKKPEEYGTGSMEGVSDASANNAAVAGAWVPALVFGIPGDSVTAIVMGVLLMKNIKPGPEIFEKQAVLVYSIFLIFFLANLFLIAAGFLAIKAGGYVVRIPRKILLPLILLFCVIGSYAINGSYFDIGVMLAMGGLGFALERRQIPLGPVVLGIILGGPLEERFIQTLSSSGSAWEAFFSRPMAAALGIVAMLVWLAPFVISLRQVRRLLKSASGRLSRIWRRSS